MLKYLLDSKSKLNTLSNSKPMNTNRQPFCSETLDSIASQNFNNLLNDKNLNNSKNDSPKSNVSNSNYFVNEKSKNNKSPSENDLALQSHRITESIKNIMNSNHMNMPDINNYYNNTISFLTEDDDSNVKKYNDNKAISFCSNKNNSKNISKNNILDNKKLSFKNTQDISIVTGESLKNFQTSKIQNTKLSIGQPHNATASKNLFLNKKNQLSQKTIGNKPEIPNNLAS